MRKTTTMILLLASSCQVPVSDLQLVESAPLGTSIGSDDLPEFHETWLEMIESAGESIELSHFYASNEPGSLLEPVVVALEQAAERGVRVRFLVDERFYETYPETLERLARRSELEVRRLDLSETTGGVLHAKYMLTDGSRSCVGSANFDWRALEHIQELGALVDHTTVASALGDVFELDWWLAGGGSPADRPVSRVSAEDFPVEVQMPNGAQVQVTPVFSPKDCLPSEDLWDLPYLIDWINEAQQHIRLQVMTFRMKGRAGESFEELESALLRAGQRGVQVQLLVADWGKRRGTIEGLKYLTQQPGIEVRMATIPPAETGHIPFARVIHSKFMVVDRDLTWIGSSNWERGYFYASRNAGLLVEGVACAQRLVEYFESGWDGPYSYAIDPDEEYVVPRIGD
ncbi:MAG: phosphatidylserine/phosphatidylglycerophosphate/cardiolipin synthase-like enzyme [Candidatus Paceibacteria bacterium]|jgi:phosphatidylserine/phosphatidylglycerophosphate/cardiolipin synthase-like enzyme